MTTKLAHRLQPSKHPATAEFPVSPERGGEPVSTLLRSAALERLSRWDRSLCLRVNRAGRTRWIRLVFRVISRLGNGVFWYSLMASLLAFGGPRAEAAVVHMILAGLVCTLLYKWLKAKTSRPRPYQVHREIILGANPLDQYSFPSGHTLHAVAFTIVLLGYFPFLGWLVVPFTALVALSRLLLGLHYPTDVLAGAFIGTLVASLSFLLV